MPNGYFIGEGAIGRTVFRYPTTVEVVAPRAGPNQGVRYVNAVTWSTLLDENGAAAGVYLGQALRASDPYFVRQTGPTPFCTQADMTQMSTLLLRHENLHWTEARSSAQQLHTQAAFERLTEIPGSGISVRSAATAAIDAFGFAIAAANGSVEHTLLPVLPNAPVCEMRPQ